MNKGGLAKGNFLTKELVEGVRHDMAKSMYPDKYWASFKDIIEDEKGFRSLQYGAIFPAMACLSEM